MRTNLNQILESVPTEIEYSEIVDFDELDERISAVGVLFANTIGVCEGYIEFCPDNDPPLNDEILSWIWAFRPDLSSEILIQPLSNDLKLLIESYQTGNLTKWWDYISEN